MYINEEDNDGFLLSIYKQCHPLMNKGWKLQFKLDFHQLNEPTEDLVDMIALRICIFIQISIVLSFMKVTYAMIWLWICD